MVGFVIKNRASFMFEVFDLVEKQRKSNFEPWMFCFGSVKKMKWENLFSKLG